MLPGEHKMLEEVKATLRGYFVPKRNVVAERYKFRSRAQKPDESIEAEASQERKKGPSMKVRGLKSKPANWLEDSSSNESEPVLSLNNVDSSTTVHVNGQRTKMIVNIGCKCNIISSQLHKSQFKNYELSQTQKYLAVVIGLSELPSVSVMRAKLFRK